MSNKYIELDEDHRDLENSNKDDIMIDIVDKLKQLFDPDNIREGQSQNLLYNLNGVLSVARHLDVDIKTGINTDNRKNDPVVLPAKTLCELVWAQFEDQTLRILIVAATISLIIGIIKDPSIGWMDGLAIFIAILIIVTITSVNDYLKEKQFTKLNATVEKREVILLRNGQTIYESIYDITVGDILCLKIGDILPVDGILVSGDQLLMDESSITGEPLSPRQESSFILSGSKVMDGYGNMLVCTVGINTQIGQMKEKLQEEESPTPLQLKLENVANDIGKIGLVVAILTVLVLIIYLIIDAATGIDFIMIGITIVVMAVPEGLPLAVTIALAFSLEKMVKENNLVKHMASCEIMGGANNICSDKTGTLTQNHMKITHVYTEQNIYDLDTNDYLGIKKELLDILCESICINSEARPKIKKNVFEQVGNKTDGAMLEFAYKLGYNYENFRPSPNILKIFPFNSERKKMTTIYLDPIRGVYKVFCKGAAETLIDNCKNMLTRSGLAPLDLFHKKDIITNVVNRLGLMALRVIAIAYKESNDNPVYENESELENNFTLIGIVGIKDPLRPEIKTAIQNCKSAGINVRMVTGDNLITACAIAKECGILDKDYDINFNEQSSRVLADFKVLEGKKFRQLVGGVVYPQLDENSSQTTKKNRKMKAEVANLEIFKKVESQLKVLARSTPEDKFTLVTGLIQLGNVVAATGDGTNDAPALKKADVGFAMGIAGTDIAKEAAGIILLDDNFSSIVSAVKWGRNIYDSIRKFLQFQLTVNIVALVLAFLGACTIEASPINPIQMLWVNLIMDTFASLALATEPPKDDLLNRKPHGRNESIITANMWRNIIGQSIYQIIILSLILYLGPSLLDIPNTFGKNKDKWNYKTGIHGTIFFNAFVMCQIFNQFNCRKLNKDEINIFSGLCNNPMFWIVEIITLVVQILIVELGGRFVKCTPLNSNQHFICIILGLGSLIIGAFIKLLPECIFNKITLLKGDEKIKNRNIDRSLPSLLRRKGSVRMRRVSSAY